VRSVEALGRNVDEWLAAYSELRARMDGLGLMRRRLKELSLEHNEPLRDGILAAEVELFSASHVPRHRQVGGLGLRVAVDG
jgi:hypothetical protein